MSLTKNTVTVTNISDLSSTPNATEGLTAAQLQARFDKSSLDHKTYINDVLTVEQDAINTTIETRTSSGWIATTGAYASATTITVASGAAAKYRKGDKIKLTQTTVKYFSIIGVADTVLTVTGGSDYSVADAAITDMYYSHEATPIGFPTYFNYTPTVTASSGTLTTTSASAKFTVVNGFCMITGSTTITNKGTASGTLNTSLPVANAAASVGSGRENAATGVMVQILAETNLAKYYKYDGSTVIVDGYTILYALTYNI